MASATAIVGVAVQRNDGGIAMGTKGMGSISRVTKFPLVGGNDRTSRPTKFQLAGGNGSIWRPTK